MDLAGCLGGWLSNEQRSQSVAAGCSGFPHMRSVGQTLTAPGFVADGANARMGTSAEANATGKSEAGNAHDNNGEEWKTSVNVRRWGRSVIGS